MKIIGLTGGIGSGKSTLLAWLRSNGIPCFESDIVGKQLLNETNLKQQVALIALAMNSIQMMSWTPRGWLNLYSKIKRPLKNSII